MLQFRTSSDYHEKASNKNYQRVFMCTDFEYKCLSKFV
jgi:hypothetical protein